MSQSCELHPLYALAILANQPRAAIHAYHQIRSPHPEDSIAIGYAHLAVNEYEPALNHFYSATQSGHAGGIIGQAFVYAHQDENTSALETSARVISISGYHQIIKLRTEGQALTRLSKLSNALEKLSKAWELATGALEPMRGNIGSWASVASRKRGDAELALEWAVKAERHALSSNRINIAYNKALALSLLSRNTEAHDALTDAAIITGRHSAARDAHRALLMFARAEINRDAHPRRAVKAYRRIIQRFQSVPEYQLHARVYLASLEPEPERALTWTARVPRNNDAARAILSESLADAQTKRGHVAAVHYWGAAAQKYEALEQHGNARRCYAKSIDNKQSLSSQFGVRWLLSEDTPTPLSIPLTATVRGERPNPAQYQDLLRSAQWLEVIKSWQNARDAHAPQLAVAVAVARLAPQHPRPDEAFHYAQRLAMTAKVSTEKRGAAMREVYRLERLHLGQNAPLAPLYPIPRRDAIHAERSGMTIVLSVNHKAFEIALERDAHGTHGTHDVERAAITDNALVCYATQRVTKDTVCIKGTGIGLQKFKEMFG